MHFRTLSYINRRAEKTDYNSRADFGGTKIIYLFDMVISRASFKLSRIAIYTALYFPGGFSASTQCAFHKAAPLSCRCAPAKKVFILLVKIQMTFVS
jgi:hypothetical protein